MRALAASAAWTASIPANSAFEPRRLGDADGTIVLTRVAVVEGATSLAVALQRSAVFSRLHERRPRADRRVDGGIRMRKKGKCCAENSECGIAPGFFWKARSPIVVGAGARERLLFHLFPFETFGDRRITSTPRLAMDERSCFRKRRSTLSALRLRAGSRSADPTFAMALGSAVRASATATLASALARRCRRDRWRRPSADSYRTRARTRLHPPLPPLRNASTQAQVAA